MFPIQFEGIDLGLCGLKDVEFLHQTGIRWDGLENAILKEEARRREESTEKHDSTMFEQAYQRALERERKKPREG